MTQLHKMLNLYREAYSNHPREVWVLGVLTLINRMGTMVLPFLSVYLTTELGFSLKQAGFLASAFGFGSLAGSYLGGKLSDKIGANRVIMISLFVSGILLVNLQFIQDFNLLFLVIFVTSLFGESYRPAMSTAIGEYVSKEETGRSMAFIRLAINVGMSAAPAVGGFVAVSLGYGGLFWIDGTTCVLASLFFVYASRNWKSKSVANKKEENSTVNVDVLPPYKNVTYLLFLLTAFVMGIGFVQWFHTVPVFLKSEWGFDERYIGMFMAINSIIVALFEMPAIHAIEKAKKVGFYINLGLILIGISFLPFLLWQSLVLCVIAVLLFTFGEIFFFPFNNSLALNMSPEVKRGEYMAWYWMAWSLTAIIGPTLGFSMIAAFGFSTFWIFIAGLTLLSFVINISIRERI